MSSKYAVFNHALQPARMARGLSGASAVSEAQAPSYQGLEKPGEGLTLQRELALRPELFDKLPEAVRERLQSLASRAAQLSPGSVDNHKGDI